MRRTLALVASLAFSLASLVFDVPAAALVSDASTFYFHGQADDDATKQCALLLSTCVGTATFSKIAPVSTDPQVIQTTTGVANQDFVANPLTAYWSGSFSGTVQGQLALD